MRLLSREAILGAFEALDERLGAEHRPEREELVVAGGAAIVLLYGSREATRDVDAISLGSGNPEILRQSARAVAFETGLPEDWLNDGFKGYLNGLLPGKVLFEGEALRVRSLASQQLLAMKLSAWRDDVDIADARLLLRELVGTGNEVWKAIEPYLVPGRELKARYAFDDLWESEHGSA